MRERNDWMLGPLPSGRHGLSREHVTRSQRLRLLAAATGVAGSDGYAAMTVTAVIERASVSRKTFYEQFADREHCFLAAYDLVVVRALEGMRAAYATEASWAGRVRAAIGWALEALAAHPEEARIAFVEVLAAGPRALDHRARALRELAALFAPGFDLGPVGVVPASMPQAIAGALCEVIGMRIREGAVAELPRLLPDLTYCALAPFVGPIAAAKAIAPSCAPAAERSH